MSHQTGVEQWTEIVSRQLPQLSQCQAKIQFVERLPIPDLTSAQESALS